MPTSFVSVSTVNYASRENTTIPAPSDIQDGDWLAAIFVAFGNAPQSPPVTYPTGFNSVDDDYPVILIGDDLAVHLAIKEAASESGDYEFIHTTANTTGGIVVIRGASGSIVVGLPVISNVATTFDINGVTAATDEAFILLWAQSSNFLGAVSTPGAPPTFTDRFDSGSSLLYLATGIMTTAGATGDKSITLTEAPASGGMIAFEAQAAPPSGSGGIGSRFDDWF